MTLDGGRGGGAYVYDGDGNRVEKSVSTTTTLYWPGAGGLLDESNSSGSSMGKQVWFDGMLVWHEDTSGNGIFLFQDQLGSTRVTGTASGTLGDDIDYESFGGVYHNYGSSPSSNPFLFTGYESDSETSSDHASFRSLGMTLGRFNRPDPYDGSYDPTNPQSLNRYNYTVNNPLAYIDPSGLDICLDGGGNVSSACDEGGFAGGADGGNAWDWFGGDIGLGFGPGGGEGGDPPQAPDGPLPGQCSGPLPSDCPGSNQQPQEWDSGGPQLGHSGAAGWRGAAPSNVQTQIQQYHDCLDKINNTPDGKLYKALSPLQMIPGWGLTPKESQVDNALEVGGKFAAFGFFKSVSNSSFFARTPFGSMSGAAADTMEAFAEGIAVPFVIAGTVGDIAVHVGCAIATDGN